MLMTMATVAESRQHLPVVQEAKKIAPLRRGDFCSHLVGAKGFEPSTSRSRTVRSTKLSHAPMQSLNHYNMRQR
jgi:hypothetical protein